jgi:hypothetical protein
LFTWARNRLIPTHPHLRRWAVPKKGQMYVRSLILIRFRSSLISSQISTVEKSDGAKEWGGGGEESS